MSERQRARGTKGKKQEAKSKKMRLAHSFILWKFSFCGKTVANILLEDAGCRFLFSSAGLFLFVEKFFYMKHKIYLAATAWALLNFSEAAFAQHISSIPNQIPVGTRPRSMGEAFVAVADDGNAMNWNPAGLARMERIQASFAYANLFGLDIDNLHANFLSRFYFIPHLTDYFAFGVDWVGVRTGDEDSELKFSQDQFMLSLAFQPPRNVPWLRDLNLGVNAKYVEVEAPLDGKSAVAADGFGWDLGLLYNLGALPVLPEGLHLGVMAHDVGDTKIKDKSEDGNGGKSIFQRQNLRWGLSYRPFEDWPGGKLPVNDPVIALDFDDRMHLGVEFWLARTLALRAGWQKDLHTDESASLAFGLGVKVNPKEWPEASVDYALTDSPVLPNTDRQFGGTIIFRNDPRLIRIESVYVNDVFASLYKHYGGKAELGRVKLRNLYHDTLLVDISLRTASYSQKPKPHTIALPPNELREVFLRAVFDPAIINVTSHEPLTANIEAAYFLPQYGECRTIANDELNLYGRGLLTWDDPAKAVAFITSGEECVRSFAKRAVQRELQFSPAARRKFRAILKPRVEYAMSLFNVLGDMGFHYVPDPNTPYTAASQKDTLVIDHIHYPAEFLASNVKAGDCDDLAVLYATLLESVGVPTALLDVPGHLFMMLDSGIPAGKRTRLPLDSTMFIVHGDRLWFPIETTLISASFMGAWSAGAELFHRNRADSLLQIIEVKPNQRPERFPPVEVTVADCPEPALASAANFLDQDLDALETMIAAHLQKLEDEARAQPQNLNLRNRTATVLGQNGRYDQARGHLQFILQKDSNNAAALNNLGNLEFLAGNLATAESLYLAAALHNPGNKAGNFLNLAFLYQMMREEAAPESVYAQKSMAALTQAGQWLNHDVKRARTLLGWPLSEAEAKAVQYPQEGEAPPDTIAVSADTSALRLEIPDQPQPAEAWLIRKARLAAGFIKDALLRLVEGKPLPYQVWDRAGAKGESEREEEPSELLWWSVY